MIYDELEQMDNSGLAQQDIIYSWAFQEFQLQYIGSTNLEGKNYFHLKYSSLRWCHFNGYSTSFS